MNEPIIYEATEPRAVEAAKFEREGTLGIFHAAVHYQELFAEGWSSKAIATEVTKAGFSINRKTVDRRLAALDATSIDGTYTSEPSTETLELFADAYANTNNPKPSGGGAEREPTAVDPVNDWIHATGVLRQFAIDNDGDPDKTVADAVGLLGLPTRDAIHEVLHAREGVDE